MKNFGETIKNVILFGSHAWGTANEYSYYDVLIVLQREYSWKDENNILDLCYDLSLKYDILLDVHLISKYETNSLRETVRIFQCDQIGYICMTMTSDERNQLITYRLDQANESIRDVQLLIVNDRLRSAVNRIYYGMFYSLLALGLANQLKLQNMHN